MPESPYGLIGIGICVPGLVDKQQKIIFMPNSKWEIKDLKAVIETEFKCARFH